jgi:outer membrane immunogenic protein
MKKVLIAGAAIAAFCSASAFAADVPVKAPVYKAAPPTMYNWSGFYIGGNAGYAWHDPTVTFTPNDSLVTATTCGGVFGGTCAPPTSFSINGGLAGLQGGYNWQINPKLLLGFETDFDWSRIRGMGISNFILGSGVPAPSNFVAGQKIDWFGTVRGRLGFLPTDRLLAYATGGFAYGGVKENVALNSQAGANATGGGFGYICVAGPNCFLGSSSRTATGWTAGGGAEYAAWNNVSVKLEYLFVSLGRDVVNVVAQNGAGGTPSSFSAAYSRTDFHVVRVGVNWKY